MVKNGADEDLPCQEDDQRSGDTNARNHVTHRKNYHQAKGPRAQRIPGDSPPMPQFSTAKIQERKQNHESAAKVNDENTFEYPQTLTDHAGHGSLQTNRHSANKTDDDNYKN